MIVSNVPRVGHAAKEIAAPLAALFIWDVAVTLVYFKLMPNVRPIEIPFSLFGSVIALFVGFMVNASYARWWEARGLWGQMINASRSLARQAITYCDAAEPGIAAKMIHAQIAYVNILRTALRGQAMAGEAATYLGPQLLAGVPRAVNKPNAVLTAIAGLTRSARAAGRLDSITQVRIETTLVDIANAQGGMERIKSTPLPIQYRVFPLWFARMFCIILPFAVVQDLGIYTPVGSALVGLMFLTAVQVGLDLMDPFADDVYDVPMTALCRTIEIDLLQMLGEPAPQKIEPMRGVLW